MKFICMSASIIYICTAFRHKEPKYFERLVLVHYDIFFKHLTLLLFLSLFPGSVNVSILQCCTHVSKGNFGSFLCPSYGRTCPDPHSDVSSFISLCGLSQSDAWLLEKSFLHYKNAQKKSRSRQTRCPIL